MFMVIFILQNGTCYSAYWMSLGGRVYDIYYSKIMFVKYFVKGGTCCGGPTKPPYLRNLTFLSALLRILIWIIQEIS